MLSGPGASRGDGATYSRNWFNEKEMESWLSGERAVEGDTAQGAGIYHWRFAPRATTKRNIEYYFWAWSAPESIPFGAQIQDGGAVLGWSYHTT